MPPWCCGNSSCSSSTFDNCHKHVATWVGRCSCKSHLSVCVYCLCQSGNILLSCLELFASHSMGSCEKQKSPAHDRIMLNAGILIFFLMSITSFSVLLTFSGSYVNNATEQDNFPTFFLYIFIPLLLGGRRIIDFLKWFMEWLRNDIAQLEPQVRLQEPGAAS